MPVPKRKLSRKRRDQRSANKGIKPKAIAACRTCQAPTMPHQVCRECGYYKGIKILRTKTDRLYQRGKAREASTVAQQHAMEANASSTPATSGRGPTE